MQTMGKVARVLPGNPDKVLKAKDQLLSDFSALVSDAEQLLSSTAAYSGDTIAGARTKFSDTLDRFKSRVSDAQRSATRQFDDAAAATQEYVRENPWKVVGAAALAAAVLSALLLNNRR
jgi:ElaB/YqjD/DUF883 family membrane-anchored ribosome-binding protein